MRRYLLILTRVTSYYFPVKFYMIFILSGFRGSFRRYLYSEKPDKMEFNPNNNYKPQIGTEFILIFNFNGNEDEQCGANFRIMDESTAIYMLSFRVNIKNHSKRKLVQNSELPGGWNTNEILTAIPDLETINEMIVDIAPEEYYKLTWNGKRMSEKYPVYLKRLQNYKKLSLKTVGNCLTFDLDKSYILDTRLGKTPARRDVMHSYSVISITSCPFTTEDAYSIRPLF